MGDKRSYADVLKEANKQLDEMTGDESVGKKKEEKKMKTVNVPIPDLKEGGSTDPMWSAAAAAAGEEFSEAEKEASSSSEEVRGIK